MNRALGYDPRGYRFESYYEYNYFRTFCFFNFKINTFGKKVLIFYLYCMKEKILELRRNGKSIKQIAKELNCAKSTVSYHCNKAGLGGDGINRKILTEYEIDKIKELYINFITKNVLAEEFGVSVYEVEKHIKGLKRYSRFDESLTKKQKQVIVVTEKRRKLKEMAIEYKGGKCEKCGYDKCKSALEFHHLDPTQKDFGVGSGHTRSWDKIKKELNKCIMVCSNCHREIHNCV